MSSVLSEKARKPMAGDDRQGGGDARVRRTRTALITAFNGLLLGKGYEAASPATVAAAAGVARSTFYEHYAGKADLLRQAVTFVLAPLARAATRDGEADRIAPVIAHFWANRKLARIMLAGRPRVIMARRLAELIEAELRASPGAQPFPPPLAAAQLANGQLAMIEEWLTGRHRCSADDLAFRLQRSTRAAAIALTG